MCRIPWSLSLPDAGYSSRCQNDFFPAFEILAKACSTVVAAKAGKETCSICL